MKELYKDRLKFLTPLFARVSRAATLRRALTAPRQLVVVQSELLGEAQTMLKNVASVLPRRPATAPDVHRLGSVITDEDTTAANGGTDYAAFEGAAGGGGELAAASDDEDSGEARAEALLAAAQTTGAGRTLEVSERRASDADPNATVAAAAAATEKAESGAARADARTQAGAKVATQSDGRRAVRLCGRRRRRTAVQKGRRADHSGAGRRLVGGRAARQKRLHSGKLCED